MIYLFNQLEELIDVIDEASLAEFTHTIELNQFDRSSFEIPVDYKPDIIKEAQFFGFQSRDRAFCLFRISEKSYDSGLTIEGIDRAESDLHSFIIEDKRPSGTADQVLRGILEGTGYQLGDTNRLIVNGKMSFYYISVRQALVKIIESFGCEFRVRYTFVENKIIGRYIDLYQRFGRKTGHQFEYGSNILNVTYEESSDEVVTALIGRGRGEQSTDDTGEATGGYGRRIQFKDVTWSVSKGDPVDKPAGQNYVANEAARNTYGLHQNGVIKHRFGVYTNENIEDPVELLKATYKELQRLSVPIATFKANLLDLANAIEQDVWIGDSIGIVRDQIGIAFEARIHKLVIDKLDDNRSVAELGDYQTLQAKDRTTRQQAIIDAVSGFSESLIEEAFANEVERRDKEFDEKMRINKLEFDNVLESVKAKAEEVKQELSDTIDQRFSSFNNGPLQEAKRRAEEALRNAGASSLLAQEAKRIGLDSVAKLEEFKRQATSAQTALSDDLDALKRTVTSEVNQASEYRRTTTEALSRMTGQMNGFATKSEVKQDIDGLTQTFAKMKVGGRNLLRGSKGPFLPDRKPANFDNNILYVGNTSIYMEQGQEYIISAKTDGNFTAHHDGLKESDNVVLWIMDKDVRNYQIVSDLKTGTTGTKIIWNKPTGIYHLRVNTYHKEAVKSVWDVKIEKGNIATDWSPAIEDVESQITEARTEFKQTADGLSTKMAAVETYVGQDNQRQEVLRRYTREESARQATAVRDLVARDYVGKATHQEDVRGIERRFEAITNPQNGLIATQIANYKQSVDGRFTEITSLISGKANQADFQRVKETSQLYERILGNTDNGIADNVARMAVTNQLFQVEVAKNASNGQNLLKGSKNFSGDWKNMAAGWKKHSDKYQGCDVLFKNNSWNGIGQEIDAKIGEIYTFSLWMKSDWKNDTVNFYVNRNGSVEKGWGVPSETSVSITSEWQRYSFTFKITKDGFIFPRVERLNQNTNLYVAGLKLEKGSYATPYTEAPEDTDKAIRTVQSQLAGSWAVQNLTNAGSIVSQINATNNQILIEAEKIRLKGKTLLDELTAIQGYFKRLFVGDASVGTLNSDIIRSNSITADKLVMDMAMARRFVSSDIFTDTLAAKEAFINKLRSVVVTATLLEGYRGRIGGFQIGTHDNDPSSFWLTGLDQFKVGMSNGRGREFQTAFWANWGNTWGRPGPLSWYVTLDGKMYCNNDATFHRVVDFSSTCSVNFYGSNSFYKDIYMRNGSEIYGTGSTPRAGGKNSVVWWNQVGDGSVKYHIDMASDKRLKENIVDSNIVALDKIKQLKMKSFDFIDTGKHEEVGLIAQEVEAVLPSVISKNPEKADDYLHIDYVAIVPYLIKSIQELNQKIEEMEKTVA